MLHTLTTEQLERAEQLAAAMAGIARVAWIEPNFKSRLQQGA
jgi:hypothetical protein